MTDLDHATYDAGAMLAGLAPSFADGAGVLGELRLALERAPERLRMPVRLAVVGQIKKGKSTLVNAILGRELAVADVLEATFRVNEFRFGASEGIEALYYGGRQTPRTRSFPLSELARLTVRDAAPLDVLLAPDRIIISINEPLLHSFELIDTPGLLSVYGTDSAETEQVLGDHRMPDHSQSSRAELERADAVLYLFDRDLGRSDTDVVRRFLGQGRGNAAVGPIRALGVMSKCDQIWPKTADWSLSYNPIDAYARARISEYFNAERDVGRLFYDVVPIIGLAAVGAQTMPVECFEWLRELADQPVQVLLSQLRYEALFSSAQLEGCPVPAAARAELAARLGQWGVLAACRYLRDGCDDVAVRRLILQDSGVAKLREATITHFGARSYLIKLERVLAEVRDRCTAARAPGLLLRQSHLDALREVADATGRIRDGERGLLELEIRRKVARGWVDLPPEDLDRVYRLTEPLASCARRLGRPDDATPAELLPFARAEANDWSERVNQSGGDTPHMREALRGVLRIVEDVYDRVVQAADLVERARKLIE